MTAAVPLIPPMRYAHNGSLNIAYQVFGEGPVDIVMVPGFISHVEYSWHEPLLARFLHRLAAFARVIAFDKRGMGQSDRDPTSETPTIDQRVADIQAVMDAANSASAGLLAWSEGGPAAIAHAHAHPDRTDALILLDTTARFSNVDGYAAGVPREILEVFIETLQQDWGTGVALELYAPSMAQDERTRSWWSSYQRYAATPGAVAASLTMHLDVDVRALLGDLSLPVLVLHRTNDMLIPVESGRYLATHVPGARYIEQASEDHMYWIGHQDATLAAIWETLAQTPHGSKLLQTRRPRRQARIGWESLTNAELDIVRLLSAGMTNQEIANRLTISPRTVQTHVTHVLAKLGVSRRSEVAVQAVQHDF